uniref:Uncharacterized protein n=1 Tax=Strigamia maritima TaxID=126957 RepID=T1JJ76_STRMM
MERYKTLNFYENKISYFEQRLNAEKRLMALSIVITSKTNVFQKIENNVTNDAAPSIVINPKPDTHSTGILPNGTYLIKPGSNFVLACLFIYSLDKIELSVRRGPSHQQALIKGEWNDEKTMLRGYLYKLCFQNIARNSHWLEPFPGDCSMLLKK